MRLPAKKLFETFLLLTVFLILANQMDFFDQLIDGQVWEYGRLSLYASMITLLLAGFFGDWLVIRFFLLLPKIKYPKH